MTLERSQHVLQCNGPGAKQAHKKECDINEIMKQWKRTGVLSHENMSPPQYGDFHDVDTYIEACNQVNAAQAAFESLPAETRSRMGNDPAKLLQFLADEENTDEAIKLGLKLAPEPEAKIVPTPVTIVESEAPPGEPEPQDKPTPISGGD